MARSKANDKQVFSCQEPHQLNYLTHLYDNDKEVENFLRRHCAIGTIENKTHMEVFKMVKNELGIPIP